MDRKNTQTSVVNKHTYILTLEGIGDAFNVNHKSNIIFICGTPSLESYILEYFSYKI